MSSPNEPLAPSEPAAGAAPPSESAPQPKPPQPKPPQPPRSLRVEIMVSYLSLLAVVVVGFGSSIYFIVRQGMFRQAESELLAMAQSLSRELKTQSPPDRLRLAPVPQQRFGPTPRDHAYFVVWDPRGRQIAGVDPIPLHLREPDSQPQPQRETSRPFYSVSHGMHLDVILKEPDGTRIVVGRPMGRDFDHLRQLLLIVSLFGVISLAAGTAGAWWLARRIVEPLDRMTLTAEQIHAKSLNQRLELEGASLELLRLKTVFNTMLDRLEGAFQRQIRFTADASHELRTPVAVILSQAEHTLSRPRTPEDYCAALDTCLRASRRMKRLVDDLLLLARADSGRLELRQEPLDLADVTRQSLALLEPLAVEKQIRLSSQLQTTPLIGDAARLGQVVTNLVTNALLYNRPEGEVFITVHSQDGRATLAVADTGIGIPQADQSRLFERFFRANQARTHGEGQGTGLGLSIVSEIVAAHQGTIEITSEPGVGTTVTVQLAAGLSGCPL